MSEPGTAAIPARRETGTFWIVLALSVLVHVVALLFVPPLHLALRPAGDPDSPLAVELRPKPPAPKAPAPVPKPNAIAPLAAASRAAPPRPVPPPKEAPPAAVARPAKPSLRSSPTVTPTPPDTSLRPPAAARPAPSEPVAPPVIASVEPTPEPTPAPAPNALARAAPSPGGDLSSHIDARRRRARDAPPAADTSWRLEAPQRDEDAQREDARRDRIAAANLGVGRTPVFGQRKQGGGLFQITRLYYSNAEFVFFGWNKDIRRNTTQTIEVRKGEHKDIRIAVIRRMIAIIREHESGDFLWQSDRLGRDVTLSARPADNAGLEDFLWQEFFDEQRREMGPVERVQR